MKKKIDLFDYSEIIMKKLQKGILITTKDSKVNSMTISWGAMGIEWGKPIFTTYIRQSRFTRAQLDKTGEFTVNIPLDDDVKNIIGICGSKSGRDTDKIKELGLTLEEPETGSVPGIKELPLTLECKVVYKQMQDMLSMPKDVVDSCYPKDGNGNRDMHIAYYAEIVNAYIIE